MHGESRHAVRERIALLQAKLHRAGKSFRMPPAEPDTCCGRGCNGCVWESYDAALQGWLKEAGALAGGSSEAARLAPP